MQVVGIMSDQARAIGRRIRQARGARSQGELAAAVAVDRMTIGRYEAGKRSQPVDVLQRIAEATGADPVWLMTGEGVAPPGADEPPNAVDPDSAAARRLAREVEEGGGKRVPIYGARPAAGSGSELDDFKEDWMVMPRKIAARLGVLNRKVAIVYVQGDSMEPTLEDGDPVMVDTEQTELRHEGVYVLRIDDLLVVKRVEPLRGGGIRLISDNPRYAPKPIEPDEARQLAVLGKVILRAWAPL